MKNSSQYGIKFFEFVKNNLKEDPKKLSLKYADKKMEFDLKSAVIQIECRQKTARKLARFIENDNFIFPSLQAAEQSSHQCVAAYHALIIGRNNNIGDMTAGLGIDAFTLAYTGNKVTAFEIDLARIESLRHNKEILDCQTTSSGGSLSIMPLNSIEWLQNNESASFDCIFIDPARRDSLNNRAFKFADCKPDIVSNFDLLANSSDKILIKASPILDVHQIVHELPSTTSIHIVCIKGECKEILIICDRLSDSTNPQIIAINLDDCKNGGVKILSRWECRFNDLGKKGPILDQADIYPGTYLYDPNAAMHKLHVDGKLSSDYPDLYRLSANTDLYCSKTLYEDFPGKILKITAVLSKKDLKKIRRAKREVATRNYPLTADQLRAKLGTISGGEQVIYGVRIGKEEKPALIECDVYKGTTN